MTVEQKRHQLLVEGQELRRVMATRGCEEAVDVFISFSFPLLTHFSQVWTEARPSPITSSMLKELSALKLQGITCVNSRNGSVRTLSIYSLFFSFRVVIMDEIQTMFQLYSVVIDRRHLIMLADLMTFKVR